MIRNIYILTLFLLLSIIFPQVEYSVENVFPNLSFTDPVGIYHTGIGNDNRLFVLEQPGKNQGF